MNTLQSFYKKDRHIARLVIMMVLWLVFMAITRFSKFYSIANFQTIAGKFPEFEVERQRREQVPFPHRPTAGPGPPHPTPPHRSPGNDPSASTHRRRTAYPPGAQPGWQGLTFTPGQATELEMWVCIRGLAQAAQVLPWAEANRPPLRKRLEENPTFARSRQQVGGVDVGLGCLL